MFTAEARHVVPATHVLRYVTKAKTAKIADAEEASLGLISEEALINIDDIRSAGYIFSD